MKVEVNVPRTWAYVVLIGLLLGSGMFAFVMAYNTGSAYTGREVSSTTTAGEGFKTATQSVNFGHTADELNIVYGGKVVTVQEAINAIVAGGTQSPPGTPTTTSGGFTNVEVYDTAGSSQWPRSGTVPAGITKVRVQAWGAGGGGQSGTGTTKGGQGGGYVEGILTVTPGSTYNIVVGLFGEGGVNGQCGSNGGDSNFGTILTASGGSACGCTITSGGTGGQINIKGECGVDEGGSSPNGGSGGKLISPFSTSSQGGPGTAPGGAGAPGRWTGGGTPAQQSGGDGANGRVIVWW